jgi:phosphoserine aminotransferase
MSSAMESYQVPHNLIPTDPRFGCGPSLIPLERIKKLLETDKHLLGTSHRMPAVKNLVGEIVKGFRDYFSLPSDYEVVIGNGGATLFFDMASLGLIKNQGVHFTCGEFSRKWFESSKIIPNIKTHEVAAKAGQGVEFHFDFEHDADFVALTLNETSTGVQIDENNWDVIKKLSPQQRDKIVISVDATSGAGQVHCPVELVDVFFFSPQKVFASEGGMWIAFMSPRAIKRSQEILSEKIRYIPEIFRFDYAIDNSKKNQTYNTPSISTLFFLNEQLKEMCQLGAAKVFETTKEKAKILYGWAEAKKYLSPFIKEERFRSMAVATIDLEEKYKVDLICDYLQARKIVYGIDPYRKLGRNQLRISLFHSILTQDILTLTKLIDDMVLYLDSQKN